MGAGRAHLGQVDLAEQERFLQAVIQRCLLYILVLVSCPLYHRSTQHKADIVHFWVVGNPINQSGPKSFHDTPKCVVKHRLCDLISLKNKFSPKYLAK